MSTRTKKERILERLADGRWHDGYDLCHPSLGGSEGLRRLRELRSEGYDIRKRLKPDSPKESRVHQYRLDNGEPPPTEDVLQTVPEKPESGGRPIIDLTECHCAWQRIGPCLTIQERSVSCVNSTHPRIIDTRIYRVQVPTATA